VAGPYHRVLKKEDTMAELVGDFIIKRLAEWGVKRIYGYPGDGINGILGGLERAHGKLDFVQVRHEEMAAFMACAHAKFTGEVGVCLATSGPGAIHLLNGLYDAKADHQPVVAIVGQTARTALGSNYQQEVDLQALFKDVASDFVQTAMVPSQVRHLIDRAFRIALDQRTVTCVIVPNDLQECKMHQPAHAHGATFSGVGHAVPRTVPREADLERAAAVLNEGKKIAILVGAGALGAAREVELVANKLQAGVAKALLGKAVLSDELPWVTGAIGLLGTKPSYDMMQRCDTLLMIGSRFPYSEFLPKEGQARGVQIDLDGRMLSLRYPMDVNLVGDSADTLRALLPLLKDRHDDGWREGIMIDVAKWWETLEERAMHEADPVNPQRVFWELSKQLPDHAIIAADTGTVTNWFARDVKVRGDMLASASGTLATMGPGVPYAIAAKFAFPERPVVALVGDGAMQMGGLAELITLQKYWREWADPRLVVLVLNNHDLNMVSWEQRVMGGYPRWPESEDVPDFSYARFAEELGFLGLRVERPEDLAGAWQRAFAADRPVVLEAITDPDVPPLPPHITVEQARNFMTSLAKGDRDTAGVIRMSFLEMMEGLKPRRD
jgi:pyruvate dehydrogenase (quinone)